MKRFKFIADIQQMTKQIQNVISFGENGAVVSVNFIEAVRSAIIYSYTMDCGYSIEVASAPV